jgi:ribosome-associated protein
VSPRIPDHEIMHRASRASGPGGQHVQKTASRVEVLWDLARTTSLTDEERARVWARLRNRVDKDGVLRVVAEDERSQHRNREIALARLREMVERALAVPRPRKATKPSRAARERRLQAKKRRGAVKRMRRTPPEE